MDGGKAKNLDSIQVAIKLWRGYSLMLTALLIPFYPKFLTLLIVICFFLWLFEKKEESVKENLLNNKPLLFLISFYLLHIVGLLWTSNFKYAGLDLQIKLPLLLFPLIFSTKISIENISAKLVRLFNFSLLIAVLFCLLRSSWCYYENGINLFFYKDFSFFVHPGYFSMFLCFGSASLLYNRLREQDSSMLQKSSVMDWVMLVMFSFAILLLASKAGVFVQLFLLSFGLIQVIRKFVTENLKSILGLLLILLCTIYFGLFSSLTSGRMNELKTAVATESSHQVHSSGMRLQAWQSAMELIAENPILGSGTGDVKDKLIAVYQIKGFNEIFVLKLNAHNQFLQSFAGLGIFAFLLLTLTFGLAFSNSIKAGNLLLSAFIVIVVLNMMVEAVLEVTAGSVFISFVFSLLVTDNKSVIDNQDGES
ncbi:MAG: O-antigen ligase family protein [Bacteroidetes bacterium]|nr:O-antigen ligase family protein [Bacteroidota bacterium]